MQIAREKREVISKAFDVMETGWFLFGALGVGFLLMFAVEVMGVSEYWAANFRIDLNLIILLISVFLIVVGLLVLLWRAIADVFQGEADFQTFTTGGFIFIYLIAISLLFGAPLLPIAILGVLLMLVARLFRTSAGVFRPDILSKKPNVKSVIDLLPLRETSVFCGEIQSGRRLTRLYASEEDRGVVIGPPGTGKTAFMVTQLLDLAERKGSFVCLDIKPELHDIMRDKLKAQGYRVLVFNPTSKADRYNLLDDISGPTAIGELAYTLIPSTDGENRAFDEGARDLVDGIISYLRAENKTVSLPALRDFLAKFSSETELIATLSQCSDPDVKDTAFAIARSAKNSRFMGSVFATLRANLRFLRFEDIRDSIEQSDFSLSEFRENKPVALFLQFEERHQETTQLLLSAMVSHLFNYFIEHVDRAPVMLMLDEIGNVPRIPGLVEKLNTIRSRKLPTWLYWQGIQQMQKYGMQAGEGPNKILGACDFQMVFRLNDNESARWFSERIGTVDREQYSETTGDNRSTTISMKEEPILKIADLQNLPVGESIAVYRGKSWRNHATPYFKRWPEMSREFNIENANKISKSKHIESVQ